MDLFKEVVTKSVKDDRSDTDSGRSSGYGDLKDTYQQNKEILRDSEEQFLSNENYFNQNIQTLKMNSIKVNRYAQKQEETYKTLPHQRGTLNEIVPINKKLKVIRRRDEILKRKNPFRRNTIDVNFDLRNGKDSIAHDLETSKSTNFIDKIGFNNEFNQNIDDVRVNVASMLDLAKVKISTLPNLKVRRQNYDQHNNDVINHLHSNQIMTRGPEFIIKSNKAIKLIDLTDSKCNHKRTVNILLLNGHRLHIICNSTTTTTRQIFDAIIKSENIIENYFLGLCALIGGDFVFLPLELKIYKVAPQIWISGQRNPFNCHDNIEFNLFLRIKFFLPTLRGVSSLESRNLIYLQLRKSILERQILCNQDDLIFLGAMALQAEIGDYKQNMNCYTISHYLPEEVYQKNKEMARYLRNSHLCRKGLHPMEAKQNFIRYVQELKEYGLHLYSGVWTTEEHRGIDVYVGISLGGISVFQRNPININSIDPNKNSKTMFHRIILTSFDWLEIENLCFSKHILCVVVKKTIGLNSKDKKRIKYKFKMHDRKSYFAFTLASDHHKFYMKLRNSFISLKIISEELNLPLNTAVGASSSSSSSSATQSSYSSLISGQNQCKRIDIPKNDYEIKSKSESNLLDKNLMTEKPAKKTTRNHVKNLKKSMLNDGKLTKLKQKFLKRSKSSIEVKLIEIKSVTTEQENKEENQNKENECPCPPAEGDNIVFSPKFYILNRNKVKMGTRVFSSQFLNKSIDNIYDNPLERFNDANNINGYQHLNYIRREDSDDALSLKSTSVGSIYFSNHKVPFDYPHVINSSIKSVNNNNNTNNINYNNNNFSLNYETISETLLEKFNNLSSSSSNNSMNDRILKKIIITKDRINSNLNFQMEEQQKQQQMIYDENGMMMNSILRGGDENSIEGFTLGISIIQGSDNNVYVKDLVRNGPGERNSVRIGDQIIAVNGISLLNLSYMNSLRILQNTGQIVELILSQIYEKPTKQHEEQLLMEQNNERNPNQIQAVRTHNFDYLKHIRFETEDVGCDGKVRDDVGGERVLGGNEFYEEKHLTKVNSTNIEFNNLITTRSMPDLPKVVAIIPKKNEKTAVPRSFGLSRKYIGNVKYPVTPEKTKMGRNQQLSLLADSDDEQVFI